MMDMRENCAKTDELIDVLFGGRTHGTLYKIYALSAADAARCDSIEIDKLRARTVCFILWLKS